MKEWLVAALGTLFLVGSSTGAALPNNDRKPENRFASTSRKTMTIDSACIGAAVAAREASLSLAAATQSQAMTAGYAARASALQSAYSGTDPQTIKKSVKSAWDAFGTTTKAAKKSWQTSKEGAWKTFRDSVKLCKGAETVSDTSNASLEQ